MSITLVGVCGTNASGKDTIGEILAEDFGFMFVSVTDILRDEARRRGLPIEREHLRAISTEWRRTIGMSALVEKGLEVYDRAGGAQKYKGLVMASFRNPGEVDEIHKRGGKQVWTDADPKIRYERIISKKRAGRGEEDNKTYEQFLAEEEAEMHHVGDDTTTLSMAGVKAKSDIFIDNNYTDLESFRAAASLVLQRELQLAA